MLKKSISLVLPKEIKLISIVLIIGIVLLLIIKNIFIFVPFIIAFIISFILTPFVNLFESYGMKRTLAVILIFLIIFYLMYLSYRVFAPIVSNEISSLKEEFPNYIESVKKNTDNLTMSIKRLEKQNSVFQYLNLSKSLEKEINSKINYNPKDLSQNILTKIEGLISSIVGIIMDTIITIFLTFFMLRDGIKIRKTLLKVIPNRYFEMSLSVYHEIGKQLRNYIKGILLEASIVSILAGIGFYIIGLKYAFIFGVLAGIFNMITFFGPFITLVVVGIFAFITAGSFVFISKTVIVIISVQLIDEVLYPVIIGKSINFHPILIILAIIIGAEAMGVIGVFFAVPLFSSLFLGIKLLTKGFREYTI